MIDLNAITPDAWVQLASLIVYVAAIPLGVLAFMRWEFPAPCQSGGVCPSIHLARRAREQDRELSGLTRDIETLQRRIDHLAEVMDCDE